MNRNGKLMTSTRRMTMVEELFAMADEVRESLLAKERERSKLDKKRPQK